MSGRIITMSLFFFNRLKKNKDIVIIRPDTGNREIITYTTKFNKLNKDVVTNLGEGQVQRFLRKIKSSGFSTKNGYDNIYPSSSSPARIYSLPKLYKLSSKKHLSFLSFRHIVSFIGTYNYQLAKHSGTILSPYIAKDYSCDDIFRQTN